MKRTKLLVLGFLTLIAVLDAAAAEVRFGRLDCRDDAGKVIAQIPVKYSKAPKVSVAGKPYFVFSGIQITPQMEHLFGSCLKYSSTPAIEVGEILFVCATGSVSVEPEGLCTGERVQYIDHL